MNLDPPLPRKELQNTSTGANRRSNIQLAHTAVPEPADLVWIYCRQPVLDIGLEQMLKKEFLVYQGQEPPKDSVLSAIVLYADGMEGISEGVERIRKANPDLPVLVFSSHADLPLAYAALKAGARGFIHAGMTPDQILRAIGVVLKGEIVAPRELLEYALAEEPTAANLNLLSPRQREILELVVEGLSNAEIARRIFLAESTVNQHLRAAYKLLGVKNRTEAAKLARNYNQR